MVFFIDSKVFLIMLFIVLVVIVRLIYYHILSEFVNNTGYSSYLWWYLQIQNLHLSIENVAKKSVCCHIVVSRGQDVVSASSPNRLQSASSLDRYVLSYF